MIVDLSIRSQERAAEKRERHTVRFARLLAKTANVYALADEEQQGELALVM